MLRIRNYRAHIQYYINLLHTPAPPAFPVAKSQFNAVTTDLGSKLAGHDIEMQQLWTFFVKINQGGWVPVDLNYEMLVRFAEESSCSPEGDAPQTDDRMLA